LVFSSIDNDEFFLCVSLHTEVTLYHYLETFHANLQIQSIIASRLGINFEGWELEAASSPPYQKFDHRLAERLHRCYVVDPSKDKPISSRTRLSRLSAFQRESVPDRVADDEDGSTEGNDVEAQHSDVLPSPEGTWMDKSETTKRATGTHPCLYEGRQRVLDAEDPRLLWRTFHGGKHEGGCIVDSKDRLLMIYREIARHLDLAAAKELGLIVDWYPVHSTTWVKKLRAEWARLDLLTDWTFVQPVTVLLALLPLALLCEFGAFLADIAFGVIGVDRMMIASFNIIVIVWARIAYNLWLREEAFFATLWGMESEAEEKHMELVRPKFRGTLTQAEYDRNEVEKTYPQIKLFMRRVCTASVTAVFCAVVWLLISFWYGAYGGRINVTASVLISLQIKVFEAAWNNMAPGLTEFENHKYPNDFFNSYLLKSFLFQAVNSYSAFFYTAMNLRFTEGGCPAGGCLPLLRRQLILIQIILSVTHVASVVIGVYKVDFSLWYESFQLRRSTGTTLLEEIRRLNRKGLDMASSQSPTAGARPAGFGQNFDAEPAPGRMDRSTTRKEMGLPERSYAEEQSKHAEFGDRQQIEAMCMLMISLGSIIIFGAVAPIMVPFCLAVFTLELRFTAHMLATHAKRPLPERRHGLGAWKHVLLSMMKVGVAFSGFLLVTYSDTFQDSRPLTKVSAAVGFFLMMLLAWEIVGAFWSPMDREVTVLAGRRGRVENKIREACADLSLTSFAIHPRRDPSSVLNSAVWQQRYDDIPALDRLPPSLLEKHSQAPSA
jgi:hypothetical protein